MMSAPTSMASLYPTEDSRRAALRLSPASTDSARSWSPYAAQETTHDQIDRRFSQISTPSTNDNGGGLLFVTANNPAQFKDKNTMQKVRKKAMNHYLEERPRQVSRSGRVEGAAKNSKVGPRSRLHSESSTGSRKTESSEQHEPEDVISNRDALKIFRGESRRRRSSPVGSTSVNHAEEVQGSSSKPAVLPFPELSPSSQLPFISKIGRGPMVLPSRQNVLLPYDIYSVGAFQSIESSLAPSLGTPLDPFQTMPQLSHPKVSVEALKFHCSRVFGTRAMGVQWIPSLIESRHAFLSTLCIASAHLDATNNSPDESIPTMALRQEIIHLINKDICNPKTQVNDFNIIALTQLICSEVIGGNETALQYHEEGVKNMVEQRGGLDHLGVGGVMASILTWVSLESAIFREQQPRRIYLDYSSSLRTPQYPDAATIPESPLFCPRQDLRTTRQSPWCYEHTLDLLHCVRKMTDLFLDDHSPLTTNAGREREQKLKHYYKTIIDLPSASLVDFADSRWCDWRYEACRIAAVIHAIAMMKRISLSHALDVAAKTQSSMLQQEDPFSQGRIDSAFPSVSPGINPYQSPFFPPPAFFSSTTSSQAPTESDKLLTRLRTAINNSDQSDCWSDMAGVLLWITVVCGAAARSSDKLLKKWIVALAVRCSIVLAFDHGEALVGTLARLLRIIEQVRAPERDSGQRRIPEAVVVRARSGTGGQKRGAEKGKRRRVDEGVAGLGKNTGV